MPNSLAAALFLFFTLMAEGDDLRNIRHGLTIPDEGYCDQPYVVVTDAGHWLCVMTTGPGVEGQAGQHVVSTISKDHGRTWSPLVDIEPGNGPEASWVMPFKAKNGRVFAFYTYNADNLRTVPDANHPGAAKRVDTLGKYVFKFSDDHGLTWSSRRYEIPVRRMRIDRENGSGGVDLFWGVGKPIAVGDDMMLGFAKVGKWGVPGTMVLTQGCFLRGEGLAAGRDPDQIRWLTLPEGDEGLRAPKGPVSDEANLVSLSNGTLYATYRTIDGYPCHALSRDGGRTWTPPEYMTYRPGGRRVKHSRAANFVRKLSGNRYLYWFHNHGGEPIHAGPWEPYAARNPAWICGGVERDGTIHWSEPEILLYDDDPKVRISYPDFIEDDGRLYVTETQKDVARVHQVDPSLLEDLWSQFAETPPKPHTPLSVEGRGNSTLDLPRWPDLGPGRGLTIETWVKFSELTSGQVLFNTVDPKTQRGLTLATSERGTLRLTLRDGDHVASWDSDPGTGPGTLRVGAWQHVVAVVDAGPRLILFVVDGVLNDGGAVREYGWGRFGGEVRDVNGQAKAVIAPKVFGTVDRLRLYDRPLRTSEAVALFRAGR